MATVNLVTDYGADDTGTSAVNSAFTSAMTDNSGDPDLVIYVPPGDYRLDPIDFDAGPASITIQGDSGTRPTLICPSTVDGWWTFFDTTGWTFENFNVQHESGAAPANYLYGSDWTFRNVSFYGGDLGYDATAATYLIQPRVSSGGTGLVENVDAMDGDADPGTEGSHGFTYFDANVAGDLTWRNVNIGGWSTNSYYGDGNVGHVLYENCSMTDSNTGWRITGNTTVRDCEVTQTGPLPLQRDSQAVGGRGIWTNVNSYYPGDMLIEGCSFEMSGSDSVNAIRTQYNEFDTLTIRDTEIQQDDGLNGIRIETSGTVDIDNVAITGSGSSWQSGVIYSEVAETVTINNSCIFHTETGRDGIVFSGATTAEVTNSNVNVDGTQITGATSTSGITSDDTCEAWFSEAVPIGAARISPEGSATTYEVPLYDRADLTEWALSMRPDGAGTSDIGVGKLLAGGEAPLHIRVGGTVYSVESEVVGS